MSKVNRVTSAIVGTLLLGSVSTLAAQPIAGSDMPAARADVAASGRAMPVKPVRNESRQALQAAHADAMAILSALERDPTLAGQLAKNPDGAEALLRARGATRAEHIVVTPAGGGVQQLTIVITIVIRDVTITITIKV